MSETQMANYTLAIQADSGYSSTTEGRCTAEQYSNAIGALHGETPPRKPLSDEEVDYMWRVATMKPGLTLPMVRSFARAIEAAHGIKGEA